MRLFPRKPGRHISFTGEEKTKKRGGRRGGEEEMRRGGKKKNKRHVNRDSGALLRIESNSHVSFDKRSTGKLETRLRNNRDPLEVEEEVNLQVG